MKKIIFYFFLFVLLIGYFYVNHTYVLKNSSVINNYTKLDNISPYFLKAIVATEDKRFNDNIGIDFRGIARAIYRGFQDGKMTEGGSTITQQLVKNQFLTQEKTLKRKLEEILIAVYIDIRYSKDEILEQYVNTIYFGDNSYGIYNASMDYFGKTPDKLTIEEAALLAGLPQAPSAYSPRTNMKLALERRNTVLDVMAQANILTKKEADILKQKPILLGEN